MPRRREGLGPAFSARLREDQDGILRAECGKGGKLGQTLRQWIDELFAYRLAFTDQATAARAAIAEDAAKPRR